MKVQEILTKQELYGWAFDEKAGERLASKLQGELEDLHRKTIARHATIPGPEFTPRVNNSTKGYVKGATFQKLIDFNPSSRDHIAYVLQAAGWKPTQKTDTGKVQIDEVVLKEIGTEEALEYYRILDLTKKLGMLIQGNNAWLKLVRDGRIHHHCSVATATHRCAHRNPNLGQVPHGDEFRELFVASPHLSMVGADLSGIELRMLAHYLSRYDSGRYADILLNGDIHQVNADKIGVSRSQVKTITYAFLYGAGDEKIGHSYDPLLSSTAAKRKGKEIRTAYVDAVDGLGELLSHVRSACSERGFIYAIDKRPIKVKSVHKALNYLLQGSAAVIAKRWMVVVDDLLKSQNMDGKVHQLAFVHDELQYETSEDLIADLKWILEYAATVAGEYYKLRCRINAESKSGLNWSQTH